MNPEELEKFYQRLSSTQSEYDIFSSQYKIAMAPFVFSPKKLNVWSEGRIVKTEELQDCQIQAKVGKSIYTQEEYTIVYVEGDRLYSVLASEFKFELFLTSKERLMLLNIPQSQSNDTKGLGILRSFLPVVHSQILLEEFQPYCCSLF